MIVGLFLLCFFAWRPIRMRFYELFLVFHVIGAILMMVGIIYRALFLPLPRSTSFLLTSSFLRSRRPFP